MRKKEINPAKVFVYDTKKQPMPGVTVKLIGTSVGTATDANGWFSVLPVKKGQLNSLLSVSVAKLCIF